MHRTSDEMKRLAGPIALVVLSALASAAYLVRIASPADRSTYSIIAVDPATGDVGAAGASCVPISAASLAVLVPGQGVGAVQAAILPDHQAAVLKLLKQGKPAEEVLRLLTDESYDDTTGVRQYGAVTLRQGAVQAAGFTGEETPSWSGDLQDIQGAVSAQGNTLESEVVVSDALAAFTAENIGPVEFPDRLMRALEAASAAGGDRRCNDPDGVQQTAEAAFIAVARADQPSFTASLGKEPSPSDPSLPWLYISVVEAKGGPNPLLELRGRYDAWRSVNLPPCAGCDLNAIPVPAGGKPQPLVKTVLGIVSRAGLGGTALACCLAVILVIVAALVTVFTKRRRGRAAGS
jgi:uncharacterized Ntn-hydrolase superfamily protein